MPCSAAPQYRTDHSCIVCNYRSQLHPQTHECTMGITESVSWLAGCMGFVWVHADSFLHSVTSPFHSFVTTMGIHSSVAPLELVLARGGLSFSLFCIHNGNGPRFRYHGNGPSASEKKEQAWTCHMCVSRNSACNASRCYTLSPTVHSPNCLSTHAFGCSHCSWHDLECSGGMLRCTAGVGWSSRGSKVCVTMLALQCQC